MFKIIFSCAFFLFFLLAMLVGMLKGKKYVWQFSASRILIVIVSAPLAVFLTALVSWLLGGALTGVVSKFIFTGGLLESLPSAPDAIRAIIASVLSPFIFLLFFLVIKSVLGIFNGYFCEWVIKLSDKIKLLIEQQKNKKADKNVEEEPQPSDEAVVLDSENEADETAVSEESSELEEEPITLEETSELEDESITLEKSGEASAEAAESAPELKKKKKIRKEDYLSDNFCRIGAACGAVCSFLILIVALMPFVGTLDTANGVLQIFNPMRGL